MDNLDIRGALERWVRAFHAALYREPLMPETGFGIETPFATASPTGDGGVALDQGRMRQHLLFAEQIKRNRAVGSTDTVVCNNGKLRYECFWGQATHHSPRHGRPSFTTLRKTWNCSIHLGNSKTSPQRPSK
jgi:hypothetical protein